MLNEKELVAALKEGNQSAWTMLIDEYKEKVFKTALSYIPFSDEAEDLAQEVFIEVYKSISNFREDASLSTWIYRITINKAINYLKKNRKYHSAKPIEDYEIFEASKSSDQNEAAGLIQQKEHRKIIQMAIQQLPSRQAKVFIMHKIEGRPYKEISELLDISISSVESLMHRARNSLQKKLISLYREMHK
jgi:RNA polymerase sigma factor (sigma-70 family)